MTDDGLTGLFQTQFSTLLRMKLQQKASKLRGRVEEGTHTGAKIASPIQFIGAMTTRTPEGRFAPKKAAPQDYSRRWVSPIDKVGDQFVDNLDQLKTPIDPKSQLVSRAAAACARDWDDEIIRAATASSVIGQDAGSLSTEAFDTGNFQIAVNFKASASVGLSVAKLNEARRIFEHYHVLDDEDAVTLVIGSTQHSDLRNQAQVTSADFNKNGGVLENGKVTRFMGFDIVVSERLPLVTADVRGCLAFVKTGMYLGMWQDLKTEILRRPDLEANPWDISTIHSFGATRTELGKVVQVLAYDLVGADINP
jgi:Phage capsid protein